MTVTALYTFVQSKSTEKPIYKPLVLISKKTAISEEGGFLLSMWQI